MWRCNSALALLLWSMVLAVSLLLGSCFTWSCFDFLDFKVCLVMCVCTTVCWIRAVRCCWNRCLYILLCCCYITWQKPGRAAACCFPQFLPVFSFCSRGEWVLNWQLSGLPWPLSVLGPVLTWGLTRSNYSQLSPGSVHYTWFKGSSQKHLSAWRIPEHQHASNACCHWIRAWQKAKSVQKSSVAVAALCGTRRRGNHKVGLNFPFFHCKLF